MTNRIIVIAYCALTAITGIGVAQTVAPSPVAPVAAPSAPAATPQIIGKPVQLTNEENAGMRIAWSEFEKAQMAVQLIVEQIKNRYPGSQYDFEHHQFFIPLPTQGPAAATSAPAASRPVAPIGHDEAPAKSAPEKKK